MRRFVAALVAAIFIAAPFVAEAQPSYGAGQAYGGDAQIHGRILSFDGAYALRVRDEKGYVDNVRLHQGTIINPTGLTLAPGMVVSIIGYNAGSYFAANEVDTPYTYQAGYPYYAGRPWSYYGPGVSLGFFFGNPGWWHGAQFGGAYRFYGGARVYDDAQVNRVYRGGSYDGRNYVVPREHGGYDAHSSHGARGHGDDGDDGGGGGYHRR